MRPFNRLVEQSKIPTNRGKIRKRIQLFKKKKVLAMQRAKAVMGYLKKLGVTKVKFVLVAKGAVEPVSTKKQHLNRRVTILVKF